MVVFTILTVVTVPWAGICSNTWLVRGFPGCPVVKNPPANAGDTI